LVDRTLERLADMAGIETDAPKAERLGTLEIPEPHVDAAGRMTFYWRDDGVRVIVEQVERKRGEMNCLITVLYRDPQKPESKPRPMVWKERHNLRSNSSTTGLIRKLSKQLVRDWEGRIEGIKEAVDGIYNTGDPMVYLDTVPDPGPAQYLIGPLVEADENNILFADGDSTKTFLAIASCVSLITGKSIIPGLHVPSPVKCLYLDWETTKSKLTYRMRRICAGAGIPPVQMAYKRMHTALADSAEEIGDLIKHEGFRFVVVDTGTAATLGQFNDETAVMAFFMACRSWNVTVLTLAHVPKAEGEHKKPIGSSVWYTQCRVAWELVKDQTEGDSLARLDLICHKSNNNVRPMPIGLTLDFSEDRYRYGSASAGNADLTRLPLASRVARYLLDNGQKTAAEIATGLDKSPTQISNLLTLQKGKMFGCSDAKRDRLWWALEKPIHNLNNNVNKAYLQHNPLPREGEGDVNKPAYEHANGVNNNPEKEEGPPW